MESSENLLNSLIELLKSDRLAYTDLAEDGGVMLDIVGNQVLSLNEVSMFLINLMRHDIGTVEQLTQRVLAEFEVDETTARTDIEQFLSELVRFLKISP